MGSNNPPEEFLRIDTDLLSSRLDQTKSRLNSFKRLFLTNQIPWNHTNICLLKICFRFLLTSGPSILCIRVISMFQLRPFQKPVDLYTHKSSGQCHGQDFITYKTMGCCSQQHRLHLISFLKPHSLLSKIFLFSRSPSFRPKQTSNVILYHNIYIITLLLKGQRNDRAISFSEWIK